MGNGKIETMWKLRPGRLDPQYVRDVLTLALTKWGLRPSNYGTLASREMADKDDVNALVAFYERHDELYVRGAGGILGFDPDRGTKRSASGYVGWFWSAKGPLSRAKSELHLTAFCEGAAISRSPYAYAYREEDAWKKQRRTVLRPSHGTPPGASPRMAQTEELKVRTYRHGLPALYWRNFFGPEFAAMFGERLRSLPPGVAWAVDGGWIVQPYEQPDDAFTEEGRRREREIIEHLGREHFWDDELQRPPSRVPEFTEQVDPLPPLPY